MVPESPCTYWAGRTNALVNCYLQRHAGAGYEKCVLCEMSMQSLRPITVNHWLQYMGIHFHSYRAEEKKVAYLAPKFQNRFRKHLRFCFSCFSLYQWANVSRWMHQAVKVNIWGKRLLEKNVTCLMHAFYQVFCLLVVCLSGFDL